MSTSGVSPDGKLVEFIELPTHPFWIGTQAHPELKSRPNRPAPLFDGFIQAALERVEAQDPDRFEAARPASDQISITLD
jgi:CTP synthase